MVGEIQPGGCFFENVPSRESLWYIYEQVIPGLRYLGYEVEAGIFSAAEVGAPHNRERIFIYAYRVEHTGHSTGSTERQQQREDTASGIGEPVESVGDTDEPRSQGRHEPERERGYERPAWPPGPEGDWASIPERLWPAVKPGFRDMADGLAGRVDALSRSQELRILGNGVVPATAERAFVELSKQMKGV